MSTHPTDYEEDYYDPEQQGKEGMGFPPMVFREEHYVRFPAKGDSDSTTIYPMPAFSVQADNRRRADDKKTNWDWYRFGPNHRYAGKFTPWIRGYHVYEFVGGRVSILNPSSIDPECKVNPVQTLLDTIKSNPDWRYLAGLLPDNKRNKDKAAIKERLISPSTTRYVMNGVNPNRAAEKEDNRSCLYTVPRGAILGGGKDKKSDWGLFPKLELASRGVSAEAVAADFTKAFYWGDITRADAVQPIVIRKDLPPTGSDIRLYNCVPRDDLAPKAAPFINGDYPWLSSRVNLASVTDLFIDYDPAHVIEILMALFSAHQNILCRAFESSVPNFRDNLLKVTGVVSPSKVHQAGTSFPPDERATPPQSGPSGPSGPTTGRFAPDSAPPPPPAARQFWAVRNGESVKVSDVDVQALVDRGDTTPLMAVGDKVWGTPASYGFIKTAKVEAPAPPAPPAPPVEEAPAPPPPTHSAPPVNVPTPTPSAPPVDIPKASAETPPPKPSSAPVAASGNDHVEMTADEITRQLAEAGGPSSGNGTPPPPPQAS